MDDEKEVAAQNLSLDLTKLALRSADDMHKALVKLPDFKVRAEKPRADDISLSDVIKQPVQTQSQVAQATFPDPLPQSMQDVNLRELGRVNINWRMLTTSRPRNRAEEDLFNRFVLLERLQALTSQWEAETGSRPAQRGVANRGVANKVGGRRQGVGPVLAERRHETCTDCTTEFCSGGCRRGQHENHARSVNPPTFEAFQESLRKPPANSRAVIKKNKPGTVEKPSDTKKTQKQLKDGGKNGLDQGAKQKSNGAKMAADTKSQSKQREKTSDPNSKKEGTNAKKKRKSKSKKVSIKVPSSPIPDS